MVKSKLFSFLVLLLLFIAVSLTVFLLPIERNYVFQISFGFICVAFIVQFIVSNIVIGNKTSLRWKFLGLSLIYIGIIYLLLQIIAFVILVLTNNVSQNTVWLVNSLILTFAMVGMISAYYGRDIINTTDTETKEKTNFVKKCLTEVQILILNVNEIDKKELSKLAEIIQYSDPVSCENLEQIENKISEQINQLKTEINTNSNNISVTINKIQNTFQERNMLCKTLK